MKKWLMPALQTAFVALLVVSFYATSWFGDQYLLRAEPYDPFDPFYGEYVMLQYPDLDAPSGISDGAVYFTLTEGEDGYAVIDRIEESPFFGAINGSKYDRRIVAPQLENFYVEQGRGPELEEAVDLEVTIDVAPWGSIRPVGIAPREE
ncbi:GDYXXLXY domain-containing protein [Planococcus sp. CP5-4]|uniref:GDYXXLXY domain-containing protein n=1 Tax=unclassified Planococcus (in: firmicutes) TaxID=2662419 RepID=UPI001C24E860|nr:MULTISPECIES: GDYXXLXY domain-containing protein [unclassified Planococcus (in: firmicutes)]MBU9673715.1 GDYXXLXY domain-containing protein [Planococcus sp. CP5-4_YE]MBV0908005.1 GDYXXLXY domain-containing protein [Planococcus sp. CP5-4_UN]MBW6063172.1 GDYXXLXY domain-containing protein [Planococcus sp. CP5-4]